MQGKSLLIKVLVKHIIVLIVEKRLIVQNILINTVLINVSENMNINNGLKTTKKIILLQKLQNGDNFLFIYAIIFLINLKISVVNVVGLKLILIQIQYL